MPTRLDLGPVIAAAGGAVLFAALFMDWYSPAYTAWASFEVLDVVLAALALAAVLGLARHSALATAPDARGLALVGIVTFVLVALQAIDPPPAIPDDSTREPGLWLALAGAGLSLVGGLAASLRVSIEVTVREPAARREVAAIDRRAGSIEPVIVTQPHQPAADQEVDTTQQTTRQMAESDGN